MRRETAWFVTKNHDSGISPGNNEETELIRMNRRFLTQSPEVVLHDQDE